MKQVSAAGMMATLPVAGHFVKFIVLHEAFQKRDENKVSRLNVHHLDYFCAVGKDGNLTRAAGRLNVSQSVLSTRIRQFEERLGHAVSPSV